jgi:outer membrane protein OmpA-like peptidoglycan-associated protein
MLKNSGFLILFFIIPIQLLAEPTKKMLTPIDPPINSPWSDFAPSFTADGKTMFFNSRRKGDNQDLYVSQFKDGKWTEPLNLKILNSPFHDETPFITPDGTLLFFSSDRKGSMKQTGDSQDKEQNSYDIYWSKNEKGKWTPAKKVPGTVNTVNHERAPSMCLDTKTLYYTSWPAGDIKNSRIMSAEFVNGRFVNAQQLPPPVNIDEQDMALVPDTHCTGFYFSSRRAGGFGGWDIYYISFTEGMFGNPINSGPMVNSSEDEFFFTRVRKTIYLCSNRNGAIGGYDIFSLKKQRRIHFSVRNKKTNEPLTATATLSYEKIPPSSGTSGRLTIEKKTDARGEFIVTVDPYLDKLDITITEDGFLPFIKSMEPDKIGNDVQILDMIPLEKEASFDLHDIHFDFDSAKIREESYKYLDSFAGYMHQNRTLRFRIIGHTDLHGPAPYNMNLSLKRAQSVKEYLVKKGIDASRLEIEGAGESRPKVPETGPGFDEQNRRTEFKLIGKD